MPNILERALDGLRFLLPARFRRDIPVVPVIRLSGTIGVVTPLRPGLMLSSISRTLERAFSMRGARAVALVINSPGGSPAQSHLIFRRIRQLSAEKELPVLAFIEDVGASGGYMLACAGDEIFCDPYSIVGSIGVVGGTFGFVELMEKLGIERRVYASGDRKVMLDPFQPEKREDVERIQAIQKDIHALFIALVQERRGAKLNGDGETLFSGEFWTAEKAIELGLADGISDVRATARARYGDKVRMPLVEGDRSFFGRRLSGVGLERLFGSPGLADDLLSAMEARALWSRFGL